MADRTPGVPESALDADAASTPDLEEVRADLGKRLAQFANQPFAGLKRREDMMSLWQVMSPQARKIHAREFINNLGRIFLETVNETAPVAAPATSVSETGSLPTAASTPVPAKDFELSTFLKRVNALQDFDRQVADIPDAGDLKDTYRKYRESTLVDALFTKAESFFLLTQSAAVVDGLAQFEPTKQQAIIHSWSSRGGIEWDRILVDCEAKKIADTIWKFPNIKYFVYYYSRETVLKIANFGSAEKIDAALTKTGSGVPESWDKLYTYLVLGSLEQSTPEQIRALGQYEISIITAILAAYGPEKIVELWNPENLADFKESKEIFGRSFEDSTLEVMTARCRQLSPNLLKHLPVRNADGYGRQSFTSPGRWIFDNCGFQGVPKNIDQFLRLIAIVPAQRREQFFAVLKPDGYAESIYKKELSLEQVDNFLEYVKLAEAENKIGPHAVIANAASFDSDSWPKLKAGVERYKQLGILDQTALNPGWLTVLKKAGQPEYEDANSFTKICLQKERKDFVTFDDSYPNPINHDCSLVKRSEGRWGEDCFYYFSEMAKSDFTKDYDLVADFSNFGDRMAKVMSAWLSGELPATAAKYFDFPLIEGEIVSKAGKDKFIKSQRERFCDLDTAQKKRFLFFEKNILDYFNRDIGDEKFARLIELATSDQGQKLEKFMKESGIKGFMLKETEKMAAHPDCIGLFYYLPPDYYNNFESLPNPVDQAILVHMAGLPSHYHLNEPDSFSKHGDYGPNTLQQFLEWDPQKLANIGKFAARIYPALSLINLLKLDYKNMSDDDLKRLIEVAALMDDPNYLAVHGLNEKFNTAEKVEVLAQRVTETESLLGTKRESSVVLKLGSLDSKIWERFKASPALLKNYLCGESALITECPLEALALSDTVLANPELWREKLSGEIWADPDKVEKYLEIRGRFKKNGVNTGFYSVWDFWVEAFGKAPWIFEDKVLALFKESPEVLVDLGTIDEPTWQKIQPFFAEFNPYAACLQHFFNLPNDAPFSAVIEKILAGPFAEPEILAGLHAFFGDRLPISVLPAIKKRIENGEKLAEILSYFDNNADSHTPWDGLPEEMPQNTIPHNWSHVRCKYFRQRVEHLIPEFCKKTVAKGWSSIKQWQKIADLPEQALIKLELLSDVLYMDHKIEDAILDNWLLTITHPNFETVFELLKLTKESSGSIIYSPKASLAHLYDNLTSEMLARLKDLPTNLVLNIIDTADFFSSPKADSVIQFARELESIFGVGLPMSIYNLLIMDVDKDLQNLAKLKQSCFFPVTAENLHAFTLIAEGDMRTTIEKLLAMFNTAYKIDFGIALEQLEHLSPALQVAIIQNKGTQDFGWGILRYREALKKIFTDSKDFAAFVCKLYATERNNIPDLDLEIFKILFEEPRISGSEKVARATVMLPHYKGNIEDVMPILFLDSNKEVRAGINKIFASKNINTAIEILKTDGNLQINEENWIDLIMAFISTTIDGHGFPPLPPESDKKIKELFERSEIKDFCLKQLKKMWVDTVGKEDPDHTSAKLTILTAFVDYCEGAGPLGQFEALALFINNFNEAIGKSAKFTKIRNKLAREVNKMEKRFEKERWDNEGRTDFYNISRDILHAAPSLFVDFLELFKQQKPAQLKRFADDIYPLYRAQLAVMELPNQSGDKSYSPRDLLLLRKSLREFAGTFKTDPEAAFNELQQKLVDQIREKFKKRYGISKIPENFTAEEIRSLTNVTLYAANMANSTEEKKQILGFYLALILNGQWEAFRRGEEIDPGNYLIPEKAEVLRGIMENRRKLNPLTAGRLNIDPAQMAEFQHLLQQETSTLAVGEVETIDVKFNNVITNLNGLKDPDLYPDKLDKARLDLLLEFGNKKVGAVSAKFFRQLSNPSAKVNFSEEELEVKSRLETILAGQNLPVSAEAVKGIFQDGNKAMSLVVNLIKYIEEIGAEKDLETLLGLLIPTKEVVEVFTRIGEDFKPTSGAMALSQDLDYLEKIILNRSKDLKPEENALLTDYVKKIRDQVIKLQTGYDKLKLKFANVQSSNADAGNPLLRDKLNQIDGIINSQGGQRTVTSTLTNNLNSIMENIRACLSCKQQGCNNDTDLSFGDSNKFFIYSNSESQRKGSISDQIVFFEPITFDDGREETAFVFDRNYGSGTPFILTNHVAAVFKKFRILKERFPESNLSLFVTSAALSTSGLTAEMLTALLQEKLGKNLKIINTTVDVDIAPTATGEHYIEFGHTGINDFSARKSGKRKAQGLVITV